MEMFEKATKLKLRFDSMQGLLCAEDLWDLSLTTLDTLAKRVNKQLRDEGEESFLPSTSNKAATNNNLRLEILKHVIEVKVKEQDDKKSRAERRATIATLKELAQTKANEQLASKSLEEIQKQIAELESQELSAV